MINREKQSAAHADVGPIRVLITAPDRAELQIHVSDRRPEIVDVRLDGVLDASNAAFVVAAIDRHLARTPRVVRLDLSGLHRCDWAGIGVLVWARNRLLLTGGTLELTGIATPVAELLSVSRLDQALLAGNDAGQRF